MSARNSPTEKKIRQLQRALRKGRTPTQINLIDYLKDRGYAQTTKEAEQIILAERVKSESHPLGFERVGDRKVLRPLVSASLRDYIRVED